MNNICSEPACPIILDSTCVFYSGANLVYTGVNTNDNLQLVLQKIDNKFRDAGLGYVFTNGVIQTAPGQPVKLGGVLIEPTTINSSGFELTVTGRIVAGAFATSGGSPSQFVKGDGSLDSGPYQPSGNYITELTGDGTASGPGSSVFTLATVFNAPATYGSSTRVPIITVNAKGLITGVTTTIISVPSSSIVIGGDVFGFGNTGTLFNLTLQTVLATPGVYGSATSIPIINVNSKGLITSISQVNISGGGGGSGTVTSVAVTSGTGISASVANPTTTPNITITNTAPDQTVVLNNGTGISVTGTYPNFTIAATASTPSLQQVVNVGNGISNFGGVGNASIQSTNFTSGRTLYLNDNAFPTIRLVDNANASNNLQIDIDTLSIDGTSYTWSSIVNQGTLTAVTATSPLFSSLGTTPNITIQQANGSQDGYLSSGDWTTFNNKQAGSTNLTSLSALTYASTSFVKMTAAGTFALDTNTYLTSAVTSVGLSMPSAFNVTNSPVTGAGTLTVTGAGTVSQYVRGDGTLANFPNSTGGGSSVNYYLNGSISQGTFGGTTYYQLSKTPVFGAGTNFTRTNGAGNGYIASFITDANDPSQLNIPGGNWNVEFYFNSSSGGGNPSFYAELYKVSATNVFTLVASDALNPEGITNGTTVDQYYTSIPVPQTTLLITDRLAIRVFVNTGGRTITLHTENGNLSEVLTTFTTGLTALNGLTAQVQNFATGTSGTDFGISSTTATHTFNLPDASATARGALLAADWSTFNNKQNALTDPVTGTGTATRVAFWNTSSLLSSNANLFWDNINSRLGIGTATPATTLDVLGKVTISYSATTDFPVVIKNTNAAAVTSNVLSFDCSATGADQPVFVNLASTNPRGIAFFASNQAITASPVAAGFQMFSTASVNFPGQMYFDSGANNSASIIFRTAQTAGTITQRMRIFANGNVSISSSATNPNQAFSVTGVSQATQFKLSALNTAPASATATGTLGEIRIVNGFIYVCVATNTWQRTALSTW